MHDDLQRKIKALNELMWERRLPWGDVEEWLNQFAPTPATGYSERLHALFLLSHFTFFNSNLMRVLLRALYRDLVQYPIVERLRRRRSHTLDWSILEPHYVRAINRVRFIGIGNPSESGTHLLYYFRQENQLSTDLFVHADEVFDGTAAAPRLVGGVRHLIFLDDFCGSGTQASRYSKRLLTRIRQVAPRVRLSYFPLFGTTSGLNKVRRSTLFTNVQSLCEVDETFRALCPNSRYFREPRANIDREFASEMCQRYGAEIEPTVPTGYGESQLLLGFAHNIPNNSLPIFWSQGQQRRWTPVFRRYTKGTGW